MAGVDTIIKQWVTRAEQSGEVRKLPGFGVPFNFDDGVLETPVQLRMAHKILKNAGYVPAEVEMLRQLAVLREALSVTEDCDRQQELQREIAQLQQKVSIMLEKVRSKR